MVTRHVRGKITWVDLESPTHDELTNVMEEFGIDSRIESEIISPTPYPITITFPDYVYIILHFPTTDSRRGARSQEVDFVIGKHFLITVRYEVIETIHSLHKVFEAEDLIGVRGQDFANTGILLERILRRLYGAIREEVERVAMRLETIEGDIFNGKEREMVRKISDVARVMLRFDTTLVRHEETIEALFGTLCTTAFFGKGYAASSARVVAEHAHTASLVTSYRRTAIELRDTNDSLLTASQNEVMKVLTVIAFITYPLSLLAGVLGMNIDNPFTGMPGGFLLIISLMVAIATALLFFFKSRRWL